MTNEVNPKKQYITRKNLIIISMAILYSIFLMFIGLCIDANHSVIDKRNIFQLLATGLNFKPIGAGTAGFVYLLLVAIYIPICLAALIYERRYCLVHGKNPYKFKMIMIYFGTVVVCAILSVGFGVLLQIPTTLENVKTLLTFVFQTAVLAFVIFMIAFVVVGALTMLVINFIYVDKPFKFFDKVNDVEPFEDEEDEVDDIANSFDSDENANLNLQSTGPIAQADSITQRSVAEELDDREKVFPGLSTIDIKYEGFEVQKVDTDDLNLEEICDKFRKYLAKEEKLYFDIDTIRIFISAFATSHLMILEGLSGTGKSSLPRYFAKFANANVLFMPVQATWRDKTNLLGYFNDFSKTYTETEFLTRLYEANYNPDRIHIFVLDEMNISRVEYYFADFLSVLEYPVESWKLKVMQLPFEFVPPVKLENGFIQIPENSYFVGTANKDDSTFTISDKVYDRAITIDFDNRNEPFEITGDAGTINISHSHLKKLYSEALNNDDFRLTDEDFNKFRIITDFVYDEFDITFGNRIYNQIESLVPVFIACGGNKLDALDFLFTRKVISKIEGRFEDYVKKALKNLLALLEKTYGSNVFKKSEKAINSLIKRL